MLTSGMVRGMYLFFPLAKLQVLLLAKLTTTSLVMQPTLRKNVLLLPSSRTDHFKFRIILFYWSYLLSDLLFLFDTWEHEILGKSESQPAGW